MFQITTERLTIREFQSGDYPQFRDFFADEENTKYLGGTQNEEQAWRLLVTYIGQFKVKGYSYMAVEETLTKAFVGAIGLWDSPSWPEPELGYWLLKEMRGKGYAREAAIAMKQHAFENIKLETLVSYIAPDNLASIKLAEKLGAQREKSIQLLNFGEHLVFRYLR